jgi:uncharacterized coiled-coil protein SlyX
MKTTISRIMLVLGLLIAAYSTNCFAQSPLVELQNMETALNADIAATQAAITAVQSQIDATNAEISAAMDVGEEEYANDLSGRLAELNASLVSAQATLTQQQTDLANVQLKITAINNAINEADKNWILANTQPPAPAPNNPANNITNVVDPNNPGNQLMFFVPTGNSTLDEQLVHQWLLQRGLVDY